MSKKVKNLVEAELKKRLGDVDGVAVISPRGINGNKNHGIRRRLHEKGLETASKLPTREEAIANLVAALLGPGRKLAAVLKGPGGKLGGILKTIEDSAGKKEAAPA